MSGNSCSNVICSFREISERSTFVNVITPDSTIFVTQLLIIILGEIGNSQYRSTIVGSHRVVPGPLSVID